MNNYKVNIQWLLVLLNEAYFLNFLYLNFLKGKSNKLKFRLKFELGEYILFQYLDLLSELIYLIEDILLMNIYQLSNCDKSHLRLNKSVFLYGKVYSEQAG